MNNIPKEILANEIFDFLHELYFFKIGSVCKLWRSILCEKLQNNNLRQGLTLFKCTQDENKWSKEQFDISLPIYHLLIIRSQFNPKYWNRFFQNSHAISSMKRLELIGMPIGNNSLKLIGKCQYLGKLEMLVLIECGISDAGIKYLVEESGTNLKSLAYLDLSINSITNKGLELILTSELNLEQLYIANNKINNIDNFSHDMKTLKILQLEENYELENTHDLHLEICYLSKKSQITTEKQTLYNFYIILSDPNVLSITTRTALQMLYESACLGAHYAQFRIGRLYSFDCEPDFGFPHDNDRAIEFLEKSAQQQNVEATGLLSLIYEEIGNLEQSYQWCLKAVDLGDSNAMIRIAYMYDSGNDFIEIDHLRAVETYEKSLAKERTPEVLYLLGSLYHQGRCDKEGNQTIAPDFKKAISYYVECLHLQEDNDWANYHLGLMHKLGEGMEKPNYELANKYLSRSAELGNEYARDELESM